MLLEESISKRVSIRKWQDKKIEREKLLNVMEAARRAPSSGASGRWPAISNARPSSSPASGIGRRSAPFTDHESPSRPVPLGLQIPARLQRGANLIC